MNIVILVAVICNSAIHVHKNEGKPMIYSCPVLVLQVGFAIAATQANIAAQACKAVRQWHNNGRCIIKICTSLSGTVTVESRSTDVGKLKETNSSDIPDSASIRP